MFSLCHNSDGLFNLPVDLQSVSRNRNVTVGETRKGFAICRVIVGVSMHTRDFPHCTGGAAGEPGTLPD